MKSLLTWYKALPPQMQMLVAMAGFGTPIAIIYSLAHYLGVGPIAIIIGAVVVVAVVALASYLIPKLFNRAARQRTKKMEAELTARGEAGPVSMDLRAAVKSNNEKFFGAIKEMRKLGISVYDLPWYVVIGDSGCGKTKLINEGGLTFSTGKPEGYQLGTLNYNWWFTEDAIFIDMAGRLCNPQEDADRREWESFLKSVGLGRKGYPINGVVCCVSAEHLLQDPPEKHEADAHVMLERLRDLQAKLGVTFATYVVITKCDKVVGFMQFFDRAERDITIKNQIFGWSRPGDFNELRDPEVFARDFDGVYGRLNELRLRRLNDEVDDFELGLAYSFPEEFRQFKEPLQIYVRTLFPAIKNPRAVKNLIFRGVYFTSATQQGRLIVRHLAERLGADAAGQLPELESLYPRARPHFVKDLLFRKVFPEQGLVFRNEQEVIRNRKLARVLTIGTVALAVLLVVGLFTASSKFNDIIKDPKDRAVDAPKAIGKPIEALVTLAKLDTGINLLKHNSFWAYILSVGFDPHEPVRDLTTIQVRLFEHGILRQALTRVGDALQNPPALAVVGDKSGGVTLDQYQQALEQYVAWYGCARESTPPANLDAGSFAKLMGIVPLTVPELGSKRDVLLDLAGQYFTTIAGGKDWSNPARVLVTPGFDASKTIREALVKFHAALETYAQLSDKHPDPIIREWSRIRDQCAAIQQAYGAILELADQPVATDSDLKIFTDKFNSNYDKLTQALGALAWNGPTTGGTISHLPALRDQLLKQRELWIGARKNLTDLLNGCPTTDASRDTVARYVRALVDGGDDLRGLDRVLAKDLRDKGLSERDFATDYYEPDKFKAVVHEVHESYAHILDFKPGGDAKSDQLGAHGDLTGAIRDVLGRIHAQLAAGLGEGGFDTTAAWVATLRGLLQGEDTDVQMAADKDAIGKLGASWSPPQLNRFRDHFQEVLRKGTGTKLLNTIATRLGDAGPWTLAQLTPGWDKTDRSTFQIPVPAGSAREERTKPKEAGGEKDPRAPEPSKKKGGLPDLFGEPAPGPGSQKPAATTPPPADVARSAGPGEIPKCVGPEFLNARAQECVQLITALSLFDPNYYFAPPGEAKPLNRTCADLVIGAWRKYCDSYVADWNTPYRELRVRSLERLASERTWPNLAGQFSASAANAGATREGVRREFEPALADILHALRWPAYNSQYREWLQRPDSTYGDAQAKVETQLRSALSGPSNPGDFALRAQLFAGAPAQSLPWDALAGGFAERWVRWCDAVGRAAQLPRRFDTGSLPKFDPIVWDELTRLRSDTALQDERITEQLTAFQRKAQDLLNAELTDRFCGIQSLVLGDGAPFGGWPYLPGEEGLTALDTVSFSKFKEFLNHVHQASETLGPLEKGLPEDDRVFRARQIFIQACENWYHFLGLTSNGAVTDLAVEFETADPSLEPRGKEIPDDSAQQWYQKARLTLGLQKVGGQAGTEPLEFDTVAEAWRHPVKTVWTWPPAPEKGEIAFELLDGLPKEGYRVPAIKPRTLGRPAELALCAFLHRYGEYRDGIWVVTISMDLRKKFKEAEAAGVSQLTSVPTVGMKFYIRLQAGRDLPGPIPKLTTATETTTKPS